MPSTIDRLRQDHANIAKLLALLEHELAALDAAGTPDYDILLSIAEYFLTYPDQDHHVREDLVYHRLLLRNEAAARTVGDLSQEHKAISRRARKFATVIENILTEAFVVRTMVHNVLTAFMEDQRRHMRMEENIFFPAALRILTDTDWLEIDARIDSVADPLFGPDVETRFAELRQALQRT
ncbi:MAG: hemerythrin domain-containing protein [Alphaproteobacteria bacterium]